MSAHRHIMISLGTQTDEIKVQHFIFGNFRTKGNSANCMVAAIGKRGVSEKDKTEIMALLDDLGKWETFLRLLHDLNIRPEESSGGCFGRSQYEVRAYPDELRGLLEISFTLTEEESVRRTGTAYAEIGKTEIPDQIRNLEKWHNLACFIKSAGEAWRTS